MSGAGLRSVIGAAAVSAMLCAAGCSSVPQRPAAPQSAPNASSSPQVVTRSSAAPHWLVSVKALNLLGEAGMSPHERATIFDQPGNYLIVDKAGEADAVNFHQLTRVQTFTSVSRLRAAVDSSRLEPSTQAVLYDDEAWPLTPADEQHDPATAEAQVAMLAHAHNLLAIATPATDLSKVLAPGGSGYSTYLRLGIAADAARSADVIDIQAQGLEADSAEYADFVRQASSQARQSNPHVVVLAGLSTNPSGHRVTTEQLREAVSATRSIVDGYWLNIPAGGEACPRCGTPQPQVAIPLLRELSP